MYIDTEVVPAYRTTNAGANYQPPPVPQYSQAAAASAGKMVKTTQVKTTYTTEVLAVGEVNL